MLTVFCCPDATEGGLTVFAGLKVTISCLEVPAAGHPQLGMMLAVMMLASVVAVLWQSL